MEKKSFYERIKELKQQLKRLEGRPLVLHMEGEDFYMHIGFENGPVFIFDSLDHDSDFDVEQYNEECYEQLYLEDDDSTNEIFYIALFDNFRASADSEILKDEDDDESEYENILFVIRTDTIDFIFTDTY